MNVLLLSNSTNSGAEFLAHARDEIHQCVANCQIVFIPFALDSWDSYTDQVRNALPGFDVVGAHESGSIAETIVKANCVFAGGGNTFRLLEALTRLDVIDRLAARVRTGDCTYIGSSAGTNIAAPTIRTTNDMPIVDLPSLKSLGITPFQVNPHFTDAHPEGLMAETRADRLAQFHERSDVPVVALYEGSWIRIRGSERVIGGAAGAKVFERGKVSTLSPGESLDRWWFPGDYDCRVPPLTDLP